MKFKVYQRLSNRSEQPHNVMHAKSQQKNV